MILKNGLFGIITLAVVCFILIVISQRENTNYNRSLKFEPELIADNNYENAIHNNSTITIKNIIELERDLIKTSLLDYKFPLSTTLDNFTMISGGQPIRNIIITTWRSGSTFLGDVINALPGNYYHYEPLLDYGIIQIRGPPYYDSAIKTLRNLLNCDYTNLDNYLEYGKAHVYLFTHNTRLWNLCEIYPQYCWNATFLNNICKLFPFQSMKTVRLRLKLVEDLLKDKSLNIKVVLLVRDPRGTLQSRKHRYWCPGEPDCDQPNLLCADMVSDYSAAIQLQKLYPNQFRALRYEDLSLSPYKYMSSLFKFFGLYFHHTVKSFLDSHTKINFGGVSSTFRDSKSAPFHWKLDLNFSEVQYIEENCDQAMKLWGYVKARNESHLREFNPLTNYSIH